jgi:hypothetical protein
VRKTSADEIAQLQQRYHDMQQAYTKEVCREESLSLVGTLVDKAIPKVAGDMIEAEIRQAELLAKLEEERKAAAAAVQSKLVESFVVGLVDRETKLVGGHPEAVCLPFCRISLLLRALVCKSATADHLCEEFY